MSSRSRRLSVMLERFASAGALPGTRSQSRSALPHHRGDAPARELRLEFRQRKESHAGERTRLRDAPLRELAREQNGGHAGNLGAVLRVGRQVPFDPRAASVGSLAGEAHQHAAEIAAEDVHPRSDPAERLRPALDRQGNAPPAQQGGEPERELLRAAFERGAELHRAGAGITLRKELEVGNVAGGGPARAQTVEAHALQLLPAPRVAPRAATLPLEPPPGVAEHGRDRRFAPRRALSRRDRDLDLLDLRKARAQAVDHGRGKGGNAARARDGYADRKSTRLNSSHPSISYAVFCLKKK